MQRCQVRRILLAAACIQILRSLFCAPVDFLEIKLPSTRGSRQHLWSLCGIATVSSSAGAVDSGPTFRTLRKPPEIPVATAVILLRTTQEAALDWGGPFSKPGLYQTNFNKKRTEGFADFKQRYATYDLSGLFNQIELLDKDPRTNRLYFSFLNEVQFRTLQDGIKRRAEQERFGFNVGTRLYRKILQGDTVGPRILNEGDTYDPKAPVNMSSPLSGQWPPLSPPLPTGALATDLAEGSRRLMDYLRKQGYCKGSSFAKTFVGTPQYWAPEVLNVQRGGGSYTQAADYWSLGAVLFVMLGGRYPFDGKAMPLEEQIRTASYSMTSAAWQRVSEEAKDMVRGLLKVNPLERLKLEDCMVHPWLTGGIPGVPATQGPDSKATVTEVSSGKPTATVPVVEHPSHSDVSARSESGGSRQKMEATKSGGSNTKASGSEESPQQQQNKQVPIVFAGSECEKDEDQDLIFCLNELLKLQVSIASSLEVACLAFRHADRDLSDNIRRAFNEANKLSSKAATVVSNYAQVAQQVSRNILPDLKLAIQEKEPNLAVSLLGIVKDWVANMKKDGEQIQRLYSDLQENVHDLILGAQRAKSGADRRLAESLQEQVADFGGPQVLALPEGQAQQRPRATTAEGINLQKAPSNVIPGGSSVPQSLKPRAPDEHKRGEESNCAVSVPSTMNMWTRHLFDHLTAVEDSAKNGEGRSDFIMLQSGANDSTPTADNYEAWKLDVLDLLFMAPGVGRSTLPKPEPFQHQALPRVESTNETQGTEADQSVSSGRRRMDSSVEDVPMEEVEAEDAIVQYHPSSAPMNEDAFVNQTSGSLLRALRELKRVDEILQGCSAFWSNMDGTVQKLAQMKEHTECLVNFANSSKPLRERFEQRLGEYTSFWSSLERLCRQYCMDHQTFSKQMHAMMREVSDAADFMDTAQSARLGVAMGYREKQLRAGAGGSINLE